jgi:hypothetical protein
VLLAMAMFVLVIDTSLILRAYAIRGCGDDGVRVGSMCEPDRLTQRRDVRQRNLDRGLLQREERHQTYAVGRSRASP